MIAIVNMGEVGNGQHQYQVRVNTKVICTFTHRRENGLAACLESAGKAVREHEAGVRT